MNLIQFRQILENPHQIEKKHIKGLGELVEKYPYFQSAHFLYLSGLKKQRSFKYNDQLKKCAAHSTDRSLLFDYITAFDRDFNAAPADLATVERSEKTEKIEKTHVIKEQSQIETAPAETPEEILQVGKPLKFEADEAHSFREWLKLTELYPIERSDEKSEHKFKAEATIDKGTARAENMELIDQFIATNPRISPVLSGSYSDVAEDSVKENEQLMTETLAHVYIEQKKYEKAILAFKVLSLKYPEKSSFFASRIQAIKELQDK